MIEHKFNLLGSGVTINNPIDWHLDFKSGYRWPKGKFYKDYVQVDLSNNADVKVPRELSRSHHFLWLGQAYLITEDEKYAKEIINQISHWIDENPVMYSINWGCAMDVAIRAVNWMYAINMIINSNEVRDSFIKELVRSLYAHGYFIYHNLEKGYPYSGNHYAANLAGLIFLGAFFKDIKDGEIWFCNGLKEFYKEIRSQVLPSGVHFERSTSYHRLVLELFFYTYLMLKRTGQNIPLDIRYRIDQMFIFTIHYIKPDGYAPLIGDEDNGQFLSFNPERLKRDHRYLLSLAAVEYNKPLYKKYSAGIIDELFFFLHSNSYETFKKLPATSQILLSKAFPDAGFCIIRNKKIYIFINNSGATKYTDQTKKWGSHAHADLLSFELAYGNESFLVDPGTFNYTAHAKDRDIFRGTKMHNTLMIDHNNQHIFPGNDIFKCTQIAKPVKFTYEFSEENDVFKGSHDGYERLDEPVLHHRTFSLIKGIDEVEIIDLLSGKGKHKLEWNFHFDTRIDFEIFKNYIRTNNASGNNMEIKFYSTFPITLKKVKDWVSKSYGIKESTVSLVVCADTIVPCRILFNISFV